MYPGVVSHRYVPGVDPAHVVHEGTIDVRKSLQIAFWVAGGRARVVLSKAAQISAASAQNLGWPVRPSEDKRIGVFLLPLQAALLAMDDGMVPVILSALGASHASLRAAILDRYRKAS